MMNPVAILWRESGGRLKREGETMSRKQMIPVSREEARTFFATREDNIVAVAKQGARYGLCLVDKREGVSRDGRIEGIV